MFVNNKRIIEIMDNTQKATLWLIGLYCIIAVSLAISKKLVFFFDRRDALVSVAPPFIAIIFIFAFQSFAAPNDAEMNSYQMVVAVVGVIAVMSLYVKSTMTFFSKNNILIGLLFFPAKLLVTTCLVFVFFGLLRSANNRKIRRDNAVILAVLGMAIAFIWNLLINGHEVMALRAQQGAGALDK